MMDGENGAEDITIKYEPSGWTNGKVRVRIETKSKDYTLKYSINGRSWNTYSEPIEIADAGTVIYAGLMNKNSKLIKVVTGTVANIEKTPPIKNSNLKLEYTTDSSATLSVTVTDKESGISKIEWYYKEKDAEEFTKIEEVYTEMNGEEIGETAKVTKTKEITGLSQDKEYHIYAVVYDVAGNSTEILPPETIDDLFVGEYVNYVDANGDTHLCRVLYDSTSEYGVQLISVDTVGTLTLSGYPDDKDLLDECNKFNNSSLSTFLRVPASDPFTGSVKTYVVLGFAEGDAVSLPVVNFPDLVMIENLGDPYKDYSIIGVQYYGDEYGNSARGWLSMLSFSRLGDYYIFGQTGEYETWWWDGSESYKYVTRNCDFRPIIVLLEGLPIVEGNGVYSDPYVLGEKN